MPNNLTAQRNLSNQRLAASGFTASVWTLSGVVLVACGGGGLAQPVGSIGRIGKSLGNISKPAGDTVNIFDLGDGGGGSGGGRDNALHVQKSPVLGSRIYFFAFDENGDGAISRNEKNEQDAQLPTGYVTDENGRARHVSAHLYGTPFADSEVQAEIAKLLPTGAQDDTLIILSDDDDTTTGIVDIETTITPNDKYVATVAVVSHEGDVNYRLVELDANGNYVPYTGGVYTINERGVISVIDGATPTDTTLFVEITNGDETEYVRVEITVATTFPILESLPAGAELATIAENEIGTQGGTDLIRGITPTAPLTNPTWMIREAVPTGFAYKFDIIADGGTYNLVLKEGESLDFEAIPGGVMNLRFWVVENNLRSNALEVAITITDADDAPVFQNEVQNPDLNYSAEIAEDIALGTLVAQVNAIDVDATDSSNALRYTITSGNIGGAFSINEATGAISVASALDFEVTTNYTLEITVTDNGTPAKTDTALVEITIIDVNDIVPDVTPHLRIVFSRLGQRLAPALMPIILLARITES